MTPSIGHDGTGTGAGWFLEKVEVTDLSTGAEFTFPCGRWLSIDMDDYQVWEPFQKFGLGLATQRVR
jgi:hypothetical protein